MWEQESRWTWKYSDGSVTGTAKIAEVTGGYQARIHVEDSEFGMVLKDEKEFFQSESDARSFLVEQMDDDI